MTTGADIVDTVRKALGDPYVYGAAGPNDFDCSGLVEYAYGQRGINVPRTSSEQWSFLQKTGNVSQDKGTLVATPGDLIFSQWPGDDATPGHVGIYIGGNQLIEAPKPGGVVHIADIDQSYYDHIYGVGHVPAVDVGSGSVDVITPGKTASFTLGDAGSTLGPVIDWLSKGPMEQAIAGNPNPAGDPLGVSGAINSLSNDFQWIGKAAYTLTLPTTWARIGAGAVGFLLLSFGLYRLGKDVSSA